jgi:cation-transporting ATPase 13A2
MNLIRSEIETENTFQFIGIVVMDNQLKPITKKTISELNKAKITSIMATGDNIYTAICVAKKCGILMRN